MKYYIYESLEKTINNAKNNSEENILDKFFDIKELKKLAKSNIKLSQLFSKKVGQELLKKFQNGITINDIIEFDKTFSTEEKITETNNSIFKDLKLKVDWKPGYTIWEGSQTLYKDKINHVYLINLTELKANKIIDDYNLDDDIRRNLDGYIKNSNHPTSHKYLTLAWVRYTIFEKEEYVVIDEIQTDLIGDKFLGKDTMEGWEIFTMRVFIDYIRHKLHYNKIYMPTYQTKQDKYGSNPPMYLYKELPNKFGFTKKSDKEGFLMLEKKIFIKKNSLLEILSKFI